MNNDRAVRQLSILKSDMARFVKSWGQKSTSQPSPMEVSNQVKTWGLKLEQLDLFSVAADPYFEKAKQAIAQAWDKRDDVRKSIAWIKAALEDLNAIGAPVSAAGKSINPDRVKWLGNRQIVRGEHSAADDIVAIKRIAEKAVVRGAVLNDERQTIKQTLLETAKSYRESEVAVKSALNALNMQRPELLVEALDEVGVSLYRAVAQREDFEAFEPTKDGAAKSLGLIEDMRTKVGTKRQIKSLAAQAYRDSQSNDDQIGQQLARSIFNEAVVFDKLSNPDIMQVSVDELHRQIDALENHWRGLAG